MFGASFFGPSYFGGSYWGKGVSAPAPVVVVSTPASVGGRKHSFRYDRWGKKKRQAKKKSSEAVQIIERVVEKAADEHLSLSAALTVLEAQLEAENIRNSEIYRDLLAIEIERRAYEQDEDEDLLLLH